MVEAFLILVGVGMVAAALWPTSGPINPSSAAPWPAPWRDVAEDLGLQVSIDGGEHHAIGTIDGVIVEATLRPLAQGDTLVWHHRVDARPARLPPSLRISPSGGLLRRALAADRQSVEDSEFDRVAQVHGDEVDLVAALTEEARQALLEPLVRGEVTVQGGGVVIISRSASAGGDTLKRIAADAVACASALSFAPEEQLDRLQRTALNEPLARVRKRCLDVLVAHHTEASPGALTEALVDPAPWIRFDAAEALGHDSILEHARRMAGDLAHDGDEARLGRAIAIVGERGSPDDTGWLRGTGQHRPAANSVRQAIARIQERHGRVGGGLSVVEQGGALALEQDRGTLSEPNEPAQAVPPKQPS